MATGSRRDARERALSLLYEAEAKETTPAAVLADLPMAPDPYVALLLEGVGDRLDEIDALLARYLKGGWTLDRLAAIDRCVLRLATYELLLGASDVPPAVSISEAVELVKRFSTDGSGGFVNGVLSTIARDHVPR